MNAKFVAMVAHSGHEDEIFLPRRSKPVGRVAAEQRDCDFAEMKMAEQARGGEGFRQG